MKLKALIALTPLLGLVACGSSSPEAYQKATARLACKYIKKCDESVWDEAGYDNVKDCMDKAFPEDQRKAAADACDNFDKKAARKCLAAGRKAKRKCDDDIDEPECGKVCEISLEGELNDGRTPDEIGLAAAEAAEQAGELDEDLDADYDDYDDAEEDEALMAEIDAILSSDE